ncbi:MAG: helix-turn-helix domain-containing protein [Magnetococcales bacterium]|nr:helix-turn-helix domain-containing protein [Magnetococcales bacterium]
MEDVRDSLFPDPSRGQETESILGLDILQGIDFSSLLDRVARHYLGLAIEKTAGNKTRAAELLGLSSYQTLTNWMKKYGVKA